LRLSGIITHRQETSVVLPLTQLVLSSSSIVIINIVIHQSSAAAPEPPDSGFDNGRIRKIDM